MQERLLFSSRSPFLSYEQSPQTAAVAHAFGADGDLAGAAAQIFSSAAWEGEPLRERICRCKQVGHDPLGPRVLPALAERADLAI